MDMLAGQIIATSGNDARRANEFPERRPKCTCGGAWDGVRWAMAGESSLL